MFCESAPSRLARSPVCSRGGMGNWAVAHAHTRLQISISLSGENLHLKFVIVLVYLVPPHELLASGVQPETPALSR